MKNESKPPRLTHLSLVQSDHAHPLQLSPAQAHSTQNTADSGGSHESALWSPARLQFTLQDGRGEPLQVELTIIRPLAHLHSQSSAVNALHALRPHLFALGYQLEDIRPMQQLGSELFPGLLGQG